jgi:ABC-type multidrug transport system ATPase subunit
MKQRVSLIRALVADADVILLDEPTKELDESLVEIVVEIIQELSKNKLIIVSVHSSEFAKSMNAKNISL